MDSAAHFSVDRRGQRARVFLDKLCGKLIITLNEITEVLGKEKGERFANAFNTTAAAILTK